MTSTSFVGATGTDIDGILWNAKWASTTVTYSFPTSASFYGNGYGALNETASGFGALDSSQISAVENLLSEVEAFTGLNFVKVTESAFTHATLRFAMTNNTNGAHTYVPHTSDEGGDAWFQNDPLFDDPTLGGAAYNEGFMHELGHALGLGHGHDSSGYGSLPYFVNTNEFSVMTYRDYLGDSTTDGNENETWGNPQSFMMLDIAALQYMYGADFSSSGNVWSGDSVYTFSSTTGEMFINGVGQGTPGGNRVFRTIWDGNGNDTYDFSNYNSAFMTIDLRPGEWSTFSSSQKANLKENSGWYAQGNIANALLFQDDTRSLIENAKGGSGVDRMTGNQLANHLYGNGGDDIINGGDGNDVLFGGAGNDLLLGDGNPLIYSGAGILVDTTSGNNSIQTAKSLDGLFTEVPRTDILYSVNVPQVTVQGTGAGQVNFYSFTVLGNPAFIYLDIDYGYDATQPASPANFSSTIQLFKSDGTLVGSNSGASTSSGGTGSNSTLDAYYTTELQPGTYYVAVSGASAGTPISPGQSYQLHVSVNGTVLGPSTTETANDDVLSGGSGNDSLFGGDGNDIANYAGTVGALTIDLEAGTTTGADTDILNSIESAIGGESNDVLLGTSDVNGLSGGAGNDIFYGRGGNDTFDGGSGSDLIGYNNTVGALTIDLINNRTTGALSNTFVSIESAVGGSGNDILIGNAQANTLYGDLGNDTIFGSTGNDTLHGNAGIDTIDYSNVTSSLTIDLIAQTTTGAFTDSIQGFEKAVGGTGNDVLVGTSAIDDLKGGAGNDQFYGLGGNDELDGGAGQSDLSLYAGSRAGALVHTQFVGGQFVTTVTNLVGSDGTDTLRNFEGLQFAGETTGLAGIQQNNDSNVDADPFNELLFRNVNNNSTFYVDIDWSGTGGNVHFANQVPGWTAVAGADMFTIGQSQVIYRNDATGTLVGYGANDSGTGWNHYLGGLTSSWTFEGVGDFTGDGFNDLLVMGPTGQLYFYDRDAAGVNTGWRYVTATSNIWDPVDVGDFDKDGVSDVLVQDRSTGTTYYMNMDAGGFAGWGLIASGLGANMVAEGVADVDGDGYDDVIFHNQVTGEITGINMAGGVNSGTFTAGPNLGLGYEVAGFLDYDNDGYEDIIVRNTTTGQHTGLDMNGGGFTGFDSLSGRLGDDWMLI